MLSQRRGFLTFGLVATLCSFVASTASGTNRRQATENKQFYGSDAQQNEFPFAVYMNSSDFFQLCSGSLIDRRWVLTAAHCLFYEPHVVLGDYNRPGNDGTEQVIAIEKEIAHPLYNESTFDNDIGLIKLAEPADISSEAVAKIAPLKSNSFLKKMLANEKSCRVLGWGLVNTPSGPIDASRLQKMRIRFVNESEATVRGYDTPFAVGAIGAEAEYKDKCGRGGLCFGDSGGPVICKQRGKWLQTGVVSFGYDLDGCVRGVKGLANVQPYYPWIQSVISQ